MKCQDERRQYVTRSAVTAVQDTFPGSCHCALRRASPSCTVDHRCTTARQNWTLRELLTGFLLAMSSGLTWPKGCERILIEMGRCRRPVLCMCSMATPHCSPGCGIDRRQTQHQESPAGQVQASNAALRRPICGHASTGCRCHIASQCMCRRANGANDSHRNCVCPESPRRKQSHGRRDDASNELGQG